MDLIKITDNGIDARELYDFLEIKHHFKDWIRNSIRDYGFQDQEDFSYFFSKSTGGRPEKNYVLSIEMAKELSMVSKTSKGRKARRYFIKCEKIAKRLYAERIAGIEIRKSLTDKIKDTKENERMHGHAYSNYTKLAYKLCDIDYTKKENFRDSLDEDELSRVKTVESMIKSMLELGKQYGDIKETLEPIFKQIVNNKEVEQ